MRRVDLCCLFLFYFSGCEVDECTRTQTSSLTPSSSPSSSSVVKSPQPSQDFLDQFTQVSSSNSGDRKHRDASAVLPFIGLTGSKFALILWDQSGKNVSLYLQQTGRDSLYTEQNISLIFSFWNWAQGTCLSSVNNTPKNNQCVSRDVGNECLFLRFRQEKQTIQ